MDHRATLSFR